MIKAVISIRDADIFAEMIEHYKLTYWQNKFDKTSQFFSFSFFLSLVRETNENLRIVYFKIKIFLN